MASARKHKPKQSPTPVDDAMDLDSDDLDEVEDVEDLLLDSELGLDIAADEDFDRVVQPAPPND